MFLVGRLGANPEVRTFQNGGKVGNLRVATSESWKDRNSGERRERTDWHHVVLRVEGTINYAADYCRKGDLVWIEGKMQTRKWQDRDGNDRYTTEVVVPPFGGEFTKLASPGRGYAWLDTGTHESLLDASNFVRTLQARQGLQMGSPDEIAFAQGWIDHATLKARAELFSKTAYGDYLLSTVPPQHRDTGCDTSSNAPDRKT